MSKEQEFIDALKELCSKHGFMIGSAGSDWFEVRAIGEGEKVEIYHLYDDTYASVLDQGQFIGPEFPAYYRGLRQDQAVKEFNRQFNASKRGNA